MSDLLSRPTPLDKCLLGIALPLDRDRFFYELEAENPKDFAKIFEKRHPTKGYRSWETTLWNMYETNIVKPVKKVITSVEKFGVSVIPDFSLAHLNRMSDFEVVTIVGHWLNSQEKIEMADGVYSTREFIDAIPQNSECMLDLIVCESVILLDEIKRRFQNITVFGYRTRIEFHAALYAYNCIIYEMNKNQSLNYLSATTLAKTKLSIISNK
jgi:hypothetical protein